MSFIREKGKEIANVWFSLEEVNKIIELGRSGEYQRFIEKDREEMYLAVGHAYREYKDFLEDYKQNHMVSYTRYIRSTLSIDLAYYDSLGTNFVTLDKKQGEDVNSRLMTPEIHADYLEYEFIHSGMSKQFDFLSKWEVK